MIVLDLGALPQAAVARVFGTQGIPSTLSRLMREKITLSSAGRKVLRDMMLGLPKTAVDLFNPFIKTAAEVMANYNTHSERPIAPKSVEGTEEEGRLKRRYAMEALFRPAREARSIMEQIEQDKYDLASSRWGLGLPLRRTQGEGYIEQFYELYENASEKKKTESLYKRRRQPEERREYREENRPDIQQAQRLEQTKQQLDRLWRAKAIVKENKSLDERAKQLRMDALTTRMVEYAKRAVEREGRRAVANQ